MINNKYIELIPEEGRVEYDKYSAGIIERIPTWGSHQPVLINVLLKYPEGDVLEFGMGDNSTHIFHHICKHQNRNLVSIENDDLWIKKFEHYKSDNHEMYRFNNAHLFDNGYDFLNRKYKIAFIDAAPANIRQPFLMYMKDAVDIFIVHDTEKLITGFGPASYSWDFDAFKYSAHFVKLLPMTSVLSNTININRILNNI